MIRTEIQGTVGWVIIDRPETLNALNSQALRELDQSMSQLSAVPEVRVLVITGGGEKAFVAGADIAEIQALSPVEALGLSQLGQSVYDRIAACEKPVIAAVNGFALGGGCELALACDFIIAAETARFGLPEVKLGILPGWGGTQRLPRIVGEANALRMIATGAMIDAAEALRIGLATQVVAPAALRETCTQVAEQIAANAPVAVRLARACVKQSANVPLEAGLQLEGRSLALCASTADKQEGTEAFLQKRRPAFTGR